MAIFLWIFKHTFTGIRMAFMKLKWYTKSIKSFVLTKVVWNKILISNFQYLFYCCRFQCLILHYGSCLYTNMTKKLQWPSENNLQELKMIGESNLYMLQKWMCDRRDFRETGSCRVTTEYRVSHYVETSKYSFDIVSKMSHIQWLDFLQHKHN